MSGALARLVIATLLLAGFLSAPPSAGDGPSKGTRGGDLYGELLLTGPASDWLAFASTNKAESFLWQSTTGRSMSEFSGFNARKFRVVDSWEVWNGTARVMPPAQSYAFRPHGFVRTAQGFEEEVFVPEGPDGFHLEYTTIGVAQFRVSFLLEADYRDAWQFANNTLVLRTNNTGRAPSAYVAITGNRPMTHVANLGLVQRRYYFDEYRLGNTTWILKWVWQAGLLDFGAVNLGERVRVALGVGPSEAEAVGTAQKILAEKDARLAAKEARLRALINATGLDSDDASLRRAFNFALTAMDNLKVNETFGPAIWAGLPWFNTAWGRDTFISLRGASISTGDFEEAKRIIRSFAAFQRNTDGRIPNLVPAAGPPPYNTADATWWLVLDVDEIVERSGDPAFGAEMFPVIAKAIERGWSAYGDPADGLLRSGEKETWMDTSADPRVGKPVEVQALWIRALSIGAKVARQVGNVTAAGAWEALASRAKASFEGEFWNGAAGYLHDYLDGSGVPVPRVRPNAFLAFTALRNRILTPSQWATVADTALRRNLISPFGVRSIEPSDPLYRDNDTSTWDSPAYHNGDVWPWTAGPAIELLSEARRFDRVDALIRSMATDIRSRDNLGTLPEILDGGDGEPKGTWTQAWSVAEFIRVFHEVVLGVRVANGTIEVSPTPLAGAHNFSLPVLVRGQRLLVNYSFSAVGQSLQITGSGPLEARVRMKIVPITRGFSATIDNDGTLGVAEVRSGQLEFSATLRFTRSGRVGISYGLRPVISILAPRGGEQVVAGDTVRIEWQTDAVFPGDTVTVDVSFDSARTDWGRIATVTNGSAIAWKIPDVDTGHAKIRLTIRTAYGHVAATESGEFTISRPLPWLAFIGAGAVAIAVAAVAVWVLRRRRRAA